MQLPPLPRLPKRTTSPSNTIYEIRDIDGNLVAEKHRTDYPDGTKKTPWYRPGESTPGLHGLKINELPLYRTEYLKDIPDHLHVFIAEGEKATDALNEAGFLALGTYGASHRPVKDVLQVLKYHPVTLWPDADKPGKDHMEALGYDIKEITYPVRIIEPMLEWVKGYDAYDFIRENQDFGLLKGLLRFAPDPLPYIADQTPRSSSTTTNGIYEAIKKKYDMLSMASEHTELRRKGATYAGSCPLPTHEDSTPSFHVYPDTRSWYCFGCRKGGDVIDFADAMGLTFD
jgi:DNA primase